MFEIRGRRIRVSRGDTGTLVASARGVTLGEADRVLLTVRGEDGAAVIEKVETPDAEGTARFHFVNADTEELEPGGYLWDLRYALGATMTDGRVTDGERVVTPFAPSGFEVMEVVGDV